MGRKSNMEKMPIVHPNAAGIDVGSKSHFAAIGQSDDQIREFGCYTDEMRELCQWFKANGVTTVAMECTGTYYKGLFVMLQEYGIEVLLVNGRQTKNMKGKTDVKDARWIQKLHALGLLTGSFQPPEFTEAVRKYSRHRQGMVQDAATYIRKIQQALRLMNLRLDVAISDVTGKSGRAIIEAILAGERDAEKLAALCDRRIKKSKEEIARALTGHWREEYLFELKQSWEIYQFYYAKIRECDTEIERLLEQGVEDNERQDGEERPAYDEKTRPVKKLNKNDPKFDIQQMAFQLSGGIDLSTIPGVGRNTILSIIAEVGLDMSAFRSAKAFASWLRLAPNNKISGGRTLSSHVPKGATPLANALRKAANVIGDLKTGGLMHFFKRIAYKKGRPAAITATAHKLAVIIWNMLTKKQAYNYFNDEQYESKIRELQINNLNKKIRALGIQAHEINFSTN